MCSKHSSAELTEGLCSLLKNNFPQVRQLFDDMYQCGVTPSSGMYSSLVSAYAARGMWADALQVLGYMCR